MATYHGIQFAKCLTCGYCSTDDTTLEMWNDYGVVCIRCQVSMGRTLWVINDGRVSITDTDDDGETTTIDLLGPDATAALADAAAATTPASALAAKTG